MYTLVAVPLYSAACSLSENALCPIFILLVSTKLQPSTSFTWWCITYNVESFLEKIFSLSFTNLLPSASLPQMVSGCGIGDESCETYATSRSHTSTGRCAWHPPLPPGDVLSSGTGSLLVTGITYGLTSFVGFHQWWPVAPFLWSCYTFPESLQVWGLTQSIHTTRKLREVRTAQSQDFSLPGLATLPYYLVPQVRDLFQRFKAGSKFQILLPLSSAFI